MITDPIGDLIARIKNGYLARKKIVQIPYSNIKHDIAKLLSETKYIADISVIGEKPAEKQIKIKLRYNRQYPSIQDIKRISKPGLRIYKRANELKKPLGGLGTGIISTSKGVMTIKQAKDKNLGGELICEVW